MSDSKHKAKHKFERGAKELDKLLYVADLEELNRKHLLKPKKGLVKRAV